jgi:hypothetical protein
MTAIEKLRTELAEIEQELVALKPGSRAYRALLGEKAALEAQLTGS